MWTWQDTPETPYSSLPFDSLPYPTRTIRRHVRMYVRSVNHVTAKQKEVDHNLWVWSSVPHVLRARSSPAMKEQNMQTFILRPIFAQIHVQKWTSVKYDLVRRLARDRMSPRQRRNRSLIFSGKTWFGEKSVRQPACVQWYFIRSQ